MKCFEQKQRDQIRELFEIVNELNSSIDYLREKIDNLNDRVEELQGEIDEKPNLDRFGKPQLKGKYVRI